MVFMVANTVVLGLATELLVFGTIFSFGDILLINERTAPFLVVGVFAIFNFPLVVRLRIYGVENLNFLVHESAMNRLMTPPESWSNVILALLDESAVTSNNLELLVRLIDEAPGAVERQDRRAEAKAWLKEHWDKLADEEKDFVNERLGYLRL
jgi:hypothetical protein